MRRMTINELEQFRQQTDIPTDTLIQNLSRELGNKSLWQLYHNLISDLGEVNYEDMPPTLATYFKEQQQLPSWINDDLIGIAEQLFLEVGPAYSACLLCRALPVGYTSLKVVKVLTSTGYLSKNVKEGTAKRLLETTQFIFNVMEAGTFVPNSKGIKHILKVRFLHAMIRCHLLEHNWDVAQYDIPINQEDMAGTILTFSVGAIQGLDKINVSLSLREKDALVHYWAVVGHVMGVDKKLLPRIIQQAKPSMKTS